MKLFVYWLKTTNYTKKQMSVATGDWETSSYNITKLDNTTEYQTSNFKCAENQNNNEKMTSVKVTIPNRPEKIVNIKLLIYDTFYCQ